jgi:hypothetical protein
MKRYLIITVDTEGDDLWSYKAGEPITTKNTNYIQPFQSLCEKYGFKPVYLTNYEMANSDTFVNLASEWQAKDNCEIGIHLHAWNNPPIVELSGPYNGNPYLIEYTEDIMRAKFDTLYNLLKDRFGLAPVSHRAGRWAMDERYFRLLHDYRICVDCSHTAGANWESEKGITRGGSNYSKALDTPSMIEGVLEVPISILKTRLPIAGNLRHRIRAIVKGTGIYLRPASALLDEMTYYLSVMSQRADIDYVEFMIHSSELMPGGSPYFPDQMSVTHLYEVMEGVFSKAQRLGYQGITLREYYKTKQR